MRVLVDTSVWSLAFRRDPPSEPPEVAFLRRLLAEGDLVFLTGVVLQEILQGFRSRRDRSRLAAGSRDLPLLTPEREDHIGAAELHATCRGRGVQAGSIEVLLAQLCIHHDLVLLAIDRDVVHMRRVCPLEVWRG